jgi:FtsZ-interacting cell division protein ZipA
MTSSRPTKDFNSFGIQYDKIYGTGEFAKKMEASLHVPTHLENSNAASILAKKVRLQQEQDLETQTRPGQNFKTVEELENERFEQQRVRGLSTSYQEGRTRQQEAQRQQQEAQEAQRQQQEAQEAQRQQQEAQEKQEKSIIAKLASKGLIGGKRTHRRKRKVVRKRYSRRLKSRSNRRGRRM